MKMAQTVPFLLRARDPVHLPVLARSHGWSQLLPMLWDEQAGVLYRTEQVADSVVELEFRQADAGALELTVISEAPLSAADTDEILARARWMLALDEEFDEFYRLCTTDPRLAHVPAEGRGRILRSPSLFEDAVKSICTTNTTWGQTKGMVRRLVDRLGRPGPVADRYAFPSPQAIALAGEGVLKDEVRLGYRAPYVFQLAQQVAAGELDLAALRLSSLPTVDLRKQLLQIKGVGPYAAAVLLVLIGRYDYIGVDSWARKLVSRQFHGGQPVSEKDIQSAFEAFGRWRALAYWFYRWDDM
jgi:3-methyladenine DNA glycosylase/8-oxoguanine DNA glycosylase